MSPCLRCQRLSLNFVFVLVRFRYVTIPAYHIGYAAHVGDDATGKADSVSGDYFGALSSLGVVVEVRRLALQTPRCATGGNSLLIL